MHTFTKQESELKRWYLKFEHLLNRSSQILNEFAKSDLSKKEKTEVLDFYELFLSGGFRDFRKKYDLLEKSS